MFEQRQKPTAREISAAVVALIWLGMECLTGTPISSEVRLALGGIVGALLMAGQRRDGNDFFPARVEPVDVPALVSSSPPRALGPAGPEGPRR